MPASSRAQRPWRRPCCQRAKDLEFDDSPLDSHLYACVAACAAFVAASDPLVHRSFVMGSVLHQLRVEPLQARWPALIEHETLRLFYRNKIDRAGVAALRPE